VNGGQDAQPAGVAVQVPRPAVEQVVVELVRLELLHHPHVGQAAVHAAAEREVDEVVDAGERERGLGARGGEGAEARPLAAGEDERENLRTWHGGRAAQGGGPANPVPHRSLTLDTGTDHGHFGS
jgi:hypothetical protein